MTEEVCTYANSILMYPHPSVNPSVCQSTGISVHLSTQTPLPPNQAVLLTTNSTEVAGFPYLSCLHQQGGSGYVLSRPFGVALHEVHHSKTPGHFGVRIDMALSLLECGVQADM